jgi:hypothetical protein
MKALSIAAIFLFSCAVSAQTVPDIRPGQTCDKLRAIYGNESSINGPAHIWKREIFEIWVMVRPNGPCVADAAEYYIQPGHTFRTRDGIILGKDTLAEAVLKLKGRTNDANFLSILGEGKAYGQLEVPPTPAFPFKTTYNWQLNPALTSKLTHAPKRTDFTDEPAFAYFIANPDPVGMAQ